MKKEDNIPQETIINTKDVAADTAPASKESSKKGKPKKEKVLSEKELAKKAAKEKADRIEELRKQKYNLMFAVDKDLTRRQVLESKSIKSGLIKYIIVGAVGLGIGGFLFTINPLFSLVAVVFLAIAGIKILGLMRKKAKLKNPYEIKKILIIEQEQKKHNEKNAKIIEAYKKEKKRIKLLKRLPYKILNTASFLISMFAIILFFFILDIGIAPTALILFGLFTATYFIVGILMHIIFYMISENKQREMMLQLEAEKERLLTEERIKSEEDIRLKLERERIKYEEEERLRIEEQARVKKEEEEKKKREEEEERLLAEAEAEKEKLLIEARKQIVVSQELLPAAPTAAELAAESEVIRNEMDKKILNDVDKQFGVPNISGIEEFADLSKLRIEYAAGAILPEIDSTDGTLNVEMDNSMLRTMPKFATQIDNSEEETDNIYDIETTNIEEAKNLIFERAKQKQAANDVDEDKDIENIMHKETKKATESKSVSGKSFMVIKQMLKDN